MTRLGLIVCCLSVGILSYFALASDARPAPVPAWSTEATVVQVYDGDTIVVEVTRRIRVRLLDCWAPEIRTRNAAQKAKGLASRDQLRKMLPVDSTCILQVPSQTDLGKSFSFGRVLGHVWTGEDAESSVSEQMVADGFATKRKQR